MTQTVLRIFLALGAANCCFGIGLFLGAHGLQVNIAVLFGIGLFAVGLFAFLNRVEDL